MSELRESVRRFWRLWRLYRALVALERCQTLVNRHAPDGSLKILANVRISALADVIARMR